MFTILVVDPSENALETLASARPSVEVLRAHGIDEAVEKLGRNRRVDAVLLRGGDVDEAIREIRADNPAGPPLFAERAGPGRPSGPEMGVTWLGPGSWEEILDRITGLLE